MPNYTQEQREQAARIMSQFRNARPYKDSREFEATIVIEAYDTAISVLREPAQGWVRTSERLPTEADSDHSGKVLTCSILKREIYKNQIKDEMHIALWPWKLVGEVQETFHYWMPLPPLPEVEL